MGYACPVCEDPQADGRHLANHLAFTAILGDAAHEAWLDDHAGDWGEMSERDLAAIVTDEVEETEFPQVFEDTVGGLEEPSESPDERSGALFDDGQHVDALDTDGQHADGQHADGQHDHTDGLGTGRRPTDGPMDDETAAILEEAREMTREMLDESERDDDPDQRDGPGDGSDADNNE